jgi:asparagine synthase (glutamine-hydrolysing)
MQWVRMIHTAARERGIATLLTAEMGNLSLNAGGLPALAEWVRQRSWGQWWAEARAASSSGQASWRGILYNSFESALPRRLDRFLTRAFLGAPSAREQDFVRTEWQEKLGGRATAGPGDDYHGRYAGRFRQVTRYDIGVFRKGALADHGIEERDPTADRRLLDFSFGLPPDQLLHDGEWRPLVRRALGPLLPIEVMNSRSRGYQGADWFERLRPARARELLEQISASSAASELLDLQKLAATIDDWPDSGWAEARISTIYRTRLPIALLTGVFLQEFEGSAAGSSTL